MPAALVISNWFGERRGTALGFATAGVPVGEWTMTLVASSAIVLSGWRTAYLVLTLPLFVIVVPLVWFTVRTRPHSDTAPKTVAEAANALAGFEVAEAIRTRAFWMVTLQWFFYTAGTAIMVVHGVPYLEGIGYSQTSAAKVWGAALGSTVIGRPLMGIIADRIGCRIALFLNCFGAALAMLLLIGASHIVLFVMFFFLFGMLLAGPVITIPMLQAETLGLKRFGALSGLTNLGFSLGLGIGPIIGGRVFDLTGSYSSAFAAGAVSLCLAGVATLLCTAPKDWSATETGVGSPAAARRSI
jgi:predicted MFS family arabinose efflux permease